MKRFMIVLLSIALAGSVIAAQAQQDATAAPKAKTTHKKVVKGPTVSEQLSEMKSEMKSTNDAQQQEIKRLSDLVTSKFSTGTAPGPEPNLGGAGADQGGYCRRANR